MSVRFLNLDAGETVFFNRQLEKIKSQTYDQKYPELKAPMLIPVSTDAGSAAETITYESYDQVGIAKMISNYADDLPRADVKGRQYSSPVRSLGDSYGYSIQEVRASAMANKDLPMRKANAARRAIDKLINDIAWFARPTDGVNGGLTGLIYNPNVTKAVVTTRNGHTTWATKTADEILADLNEVVSDMIALTKGLEVPDTILLPIDEYALISTTPRSSTSDTTILEFFLKNNPSITRVEWVNELADMAIKPVSGNVGPINVMVCYKRNPDNLTLEIPQPFEQFAAEPRGLEFVVPCHARCGGVIVYYPLSVSIIEGI